MRWMKLSFAAFGLVLAYALLASGGTAQAQSCQSISPTPGVIYAPDSGNTCGVITRTGTALDVTAAVSASISGFTAASTGTPITATTGGATGTLPAGTVVVAFNKGTTNTAYCKLGASATTGDVAISPNGGWFAFTVGASTQLTCITSTSTTSVNLIGGAGLPTGTGGGGGGSGGGGAVTIADGANVVEGTLGDTSATGTVVGFLSSLWTKFNAAMGVIGEAVAPTQMIVTGGVYAGADQTLDAGDSAALQLTAAGNLKVDVQSATGVAQGSTSSGQSLSPIGGRTLSATPTDTTAQTNMTVQTVNGATVVMPYALSDRQTQGTTSSMTGTTSTSLLAAPASGLRNYVTSMVCVNSDATVGTLVSIQDGNGGTIIGSVAAASLYGGSAVNFPVPLKQPTTATALYVANVTTSAEVICTAVGFTAP